MISFYNTTALLDALFDLLLYLYDKQLRSCQDGQFLNHIAPWQASCVHSFTSN